MLHTKRLFLCCNLELGIRICAWFHSALQARITAKLCLGLLLDAKGMTYKSSVKCLAVYGRHCMFILFQVDMPFPSEDHAVLWSVRYSALYSQSHFFFSWSIFGTNFLMLLFFLFPRCKTLQDKLYSPDLVLNFWHDWHQMVIGDQLTSNLAVNLEVIDAFLFPSISFCSFSSQHVFSRTGWLQAALNDWNHSMPKELSGSK